MCSLHIQNDRSHEENQERAYIAASRRADRSLEARVQSARMASEIHKKRTGKGFKITEDIVMREEMYEEEEDDLPRQYRAFAAHLQTGSSDMNTRVNAYVTSQVALASLARQQEVDRLFAEQFPMAAQAAQLQHMHGHASPHPTHQLHGFHFASHQQARERTQSMPDAMAPLSPYHHVNNPYRPSSTRHASIDEHISFATSPTSGSAASRTGTTPVTSYSSEETTTKQASAVPVDPLLTISTLPDEQPASLFSSELTPETKMLLGGDINEHIMSAMYAGELMGSDGYFTEPQGSTSYHMYLPYGQHLSTQESLCTAFDIHESQSQGTQIGQLTQASGSGTPNAQVDFDQWLTDPNLNR